MIQDVSLWQGTTWHKRVGLAKLIDFKTSAAVFVLAWDRISPSLFIRMTSLKVDGISSRTVVADLEYLFEKWEITAHGFILKLKSYCYKYVQWRKRSHRSILALKLELDFHIQVWPIGRCLHSKGARKWRASRFCFRQICQQVSDLFKHYLKRNSLWGNDSGTTPRMQLTQWTGAALRAGSLECS